MTPYELQMILSLKCAFDWKKDCGHDQSTNHWKETLVKFRELGLIDRDEYATDRLSAFVSALCNVPLPIQKWVMPEEKP